MSAPRFRGGPYGATSSAAASSGGPWWAHHGPGVGPIFDSIVERFIPQEYAALNGMPMGCSEAEVREWPNSYASV